MKAVLFIFVLNLIFLSMVKGAPSDFGISDDCFDNDDFCYTYGLKWNEELGRKVIRVDFYAQLSVDDYDGVNELVDLFLDFNSWDDYTANLADYKNVSAALKVNDVVFVSSNGEDLEHTVHYWTTAPWPISKMEIKERSIYTPFEEPGTLVGYKFFLDKNYNNKGLKYKTGYVRMYEDEDEEMYYAVVSLDVVPQLDFLPSVAAPYVSKGLVAIFKGMFDM